MNLVLGLLFASLVVIVLPKSVHPSNESLKAQKPLIKKIYGKNILADQIGLYIDCHHFNRKENHVKKCRVMDPENSSQNFPVCRRVIVDGKTLHADCTHQQPDSLLDEFHSKCELDEKNSDLQACHCVASMCNFKNQSLPAFD